MQHCQRKIKGLQHWLLCNKCGCRFHRTCVAPGISPYGFSQLKKTLWHCQDCSNISAVTDDTDYDTNDNLDTPFDTNSGSSLLASNSDFNFNAIKGLKFGHLNINGLDGKFDELQSFLTTFNFHVFSLNELRLGSVKKLSFYEIPNYTFLPFLNSPKYRGGSAFYVHDSCKFQEIQFKTVFPDFVEVNIIEVKIPFTKPILIINVYRTPSCSPLVFLNSLNDLLIEFSDHDKNILMMGDFNINLKSSDSEAFLIKSLAKQFNLRQVITSPTRIKPTSETLIDHAYVSQYLDNN